MANYGKLDINKITNDIFEAVKKYNQNLFIILNKNTEKAIEAHFPNKDSAPYGKSFIKSYMLFCGFKIINDENLEFGEIKICAEVN